MAAIRFVSGVALAVLLVATGCSSPDDPVRATPPPASAESATPETSPTTSAPDTTAALGSRFTLAPGIPVRLDDGRLTLRLVEVPSDSRCPVDVTCVWAGEATVVLTATIANADTRLELHSPANATPDAAVGDYQVRLLALHPEPRSKQPVAQSEYRVDLIVTRG
ncbi:hypothetical protein LTV02_02470 [Nocardia yamanashiensis]|uniref:hypothetical protein n=1 Tax=Nocardia yamanashiensis TaxID=209247 RepID=UPI001E32DF2C|nr:hypothetical protein [Nocardia yamanashiensis]UGT42309.1 hypothetical protein LTV02_02470 [Nocardia yamanashiensis]